MITCAFEDGGNASLRHAVIDTLVLKDGKLLMVKRAARMLEGGKWGVIGGFVDRDETIAQAAAREIMEETAWKVSGLTLLTVVDRPDRPNEDRQNIAFVFFCRALEEVGTPDDESDEIKWFPLSEVPPKDQIAFDHANHIELYKEYLAEKPTLPIIGIS